MDTIIKNKIIWDFLRSSEVRSKYSWEFNDLYELLHKYNDGISRSHFMSVLDEYVNLGDVIINNGEFIILVG